jgi:hypothetical protein
VNEKKLKLLWSGREKFERLLLPSREQLERFYEGTAPSLLFLFLFFRYYSSHSVWLIPHHRLQSGGSGSGGAPAAWAVRRDRGGGDSVEVFVGTWNMGNAPPQKCLSPWLQPEANYDLYAISAQEVNSETDLFKLVQVPCACACAVVRVRSLVCGGTRVCAIGEDVVSEPPYRRNWARIT